MGEFSDMADEWGHKAQGHSQSDGTPSGMASKEWIEAREIDIEDLARVADEMSMAAVHSILLLGPGRTMRALFETGVQLGYEVAVKRERKGVIDDG